MHADALGEQNGVHPAVQDVQFLRRCGSQPVHEYRDGIARGEGQVGQDGPRQAFGDLVGWHQRTALHPRLAMDAHTDLHLIVADGEGGYPGHGHRARGERHAHGARGLHGTPRNAHHFVQICAFRGGGAGDLVGVKEAGHASPPLPLFRGRRGDVVRNEHRLHADIVHGGHLCRHVKVHGVALIVAVQVQATGAALHGTRGLQHRFRARGGEHVPDGHAVGQPLPHISQEYGQVP